MQWNESGYRWMDSLTDPPYSHECSSCSHTPGLSFHSRRGRKKEAQKEDTKTKEQADPLPTFVTRRAGFTHGLTF